MASEIRVDTSKNTSGLCTVTYSNTGAVLSGITTGTFSGSGASLTTLNGSNISSGTVATARLGSGTASSSTFLRGDGSWASNTSTTINSNADNRIITGSGTANTLNGESNFTYDGDEVAIYAQTDDTDCILHLVGKTASGGVGQAGRTAIIAESTHNSNGQSSMHLRTRNTSNSQLIAMTLDGNQNVGIGTQLPDNRLEIYKGSAGTYLKAGGDNGNNARALTFTSSATINSIDGGKHTINASSAHGELALATTGTDRLRIDKSGRLLYGKTSSTLETSLVLCGNSNSYTTNPGVLQLEMGNTPSNLGSLGVISFGTQDKIGARIDGRADQDWTLNSARGTHIRFLTCDNGTTQLDERLRITNAGIIQCGTSGVLKAEINNAVSGHQFISQCDDNETGFEIYQQHGSTSTRNTLACYDNRGSAGAKLQSFAVRGDGVVLMQATSSSGSSDDNIGFTHVVHGTSPYIRIRHQYSNSTGHTLFHMLGASGNLIGEIKQDGSGGVTYHSASDYRLKENVVDLTGAITRLKNLKPKRFNFKISTDVTQDGFLAHELQEVVPIAVSGTKDEVVTDDSKSKIPTLADKDIGDPVYQTVDTSRVVPLLTAALQEAITKIETLETKVAALESS